MKEKIRKKIVLLLILLYNSTIIYGNYDGTINTDSLELNFQELSGYDVLIFKEERTTRLIRKK